MSKGRKKCLSKNNSQQLEIETLNVIIVCNHNRLDSIRTFPFPLFSLIKQTWMSEVGERWSAWRIISKQSFSRTKFWSKDCRLIRLNIEYIRRNYLSLAYCYKEWIFCFPFRFSISLNLGSLYPGGFRLPRLSSWLHYLLMPCGFIIEHLAQGRISLFLEAKHFILIKYGKMLGLYTDNQGSFLTLGHYRFNQLQLLVTD